MDSFRYKESKGRKLLQHLSTNLKMKGTLFEVGFFDEAVGHASGIEFGGRAETEVDLHIERGLVLPESSFSLDSPEFEVRFLDYAVTGDATVQFDVEEADGHPRSTLEANVEDLQMFMKGHEDAAMVGTTLELRSVSDEPNLARRFSIAELVFDLPYIEVPDVSVFNDTLPAYSPTRMVSGGAVVSTHFEIHDNRKAQGSVSFLGDEILVEALEEQYQASVELTAELRTEELGGKAFHVDGTTIDIDRILIPEMKKAKGNDWWMHVEIPEGAIDLNEGTKIDATVDFQMRDVRPFIVLLKETRDEEKGPGWFWLIPDVKDIDGTVTMNMAPHDLNLEKLDVTGKGTKILAEMRVGGDGTDGLLYAKYKVFSAGIDFREGHKKWRMKKPKVWYEEESVLWPEPAESPAESSDPADATTPGEKPAGK